MSHLRSTLTTLAAGTALATTTLVVTPVAGATSASTAAKVAVPVAHPCNTSVSITQNKITYSAPVYKSASGQYGACTLAYGTTGSKQVAAMQHGLNTYASLMHLKGYTPITTFGNFLSITRKDLTLFQRAYGIPATGTFDVATSSAMLDTVGYLLG